MTDFVQKEPDEGQPPTDRMEIRLAYDDDALYIGARMHSSVPIQAPSAGATTGIKPSTCWFLSIPTSIAERRRRSASRPQASASTRFTRATTSGTMMRRSTNLTFEATVNPDFGQVEADPAEVNLSAFETFFEERRPFFVESSNLLQGNVNNYFYSRRIGARPSVNVDGDFVDSPSTATILGAAKLTGRLASGTSVGMLGAITDDESARTFTDQVFGRVRVAPRTSYGVARVEQEFGRSGSTVGLMATAVHRQLSGEDPVAAVLSREALSLSGDSIIRLGDYELRAALGMACVGGAPAAILRLQRSSARYYQRPDPLRARRPKPHVAVGAKEQFSLNGRTAGIGDGRRTSPLKQPDSKRTIPAGSPVPMRSPPAAASSTRTPRPDRGTVATR